MPDFCYFINTYIILILHLHFTCDDYIFQMIVFTVKAGNTETVSTLE